MSVKNLRKEISDSEFEKRSRDFIRNGAPVFEDVLEDQRQKQNESQEKEKEDERTMISMRIPTKLLKEMDKAAKKRYMNRSTWIIEMIQEKLQKENS